MVRSGIILGYLYKRTQFKLIIFQLLTAVDWCGDPPEVQGAAVTATGRKAGSVAVYSCHQGFVAVAGQQVGVTSAVLYGHSVFTGILWFIYCYLFICEGVEMRTRR